MTTTITTTDSFVFAESPVISGVCAACGKSVKQTIDDNDQPIDLEIGYRIRTILFSPGGRTFEKVPSQFLHVCSEAVARKSDSLRNTSIGQLALL
jgi:hypothetical protein